MTGAEVLAECRARNIVLEPNGGQLDIDAPDGALTDELLERLRTHKVELLVVLQPQYLAGPAAPRPRSAVPVAAEWPGAAADFVLLLTPDDLPEAPFNLNAWTEVRDAAKMLRSLRADILRGPTGPRAFYGALQRDLQDVQRFALQAAETGPRIGQDERGRGRETRIECLTASPVVDSLALG